MVKIDDYRDKKTGGVDWASYRKAQKENGEICHECGQWIFTSTGHLSLCSDCEDFKRNPKEVTHKSRLRCPKCSFSFDAEDLYEEGRHHRYCPQCEYEFTVETYIEYSFTSPARVS